MSKLTIKTLHYKFINPTDKTLSRTLQLKFFFNSFYFRDKIMDDKFTYKIILSVDKNYWLKRMDTTNFELTNQRKYATQLLLCWLILKTFRTIQNCY